MQSANCIATSRTPTRQELAVGSHIVLTSGIEWKPQDEWLACAPTCVTLGLVSVHIDMG